MSQQVSFEGREREGLFLYSCKGVWLAGHTLIHYPFDNFINQYEVNTMLIQLILNSSRSKVKSSLTA